MYLKNAKTLAMELLLMKNPPNSSKGSISGDDSAMAILVDDAKQEIM